MILVRMKTGANSDQNRVSGNAELLAQDAGPSGRASLGRGRSHSEITSSFPAHNLVFCDCARDASEQNKIRGGEFSRQRSASPIDEHRAAIV